MAKFLNTSGVSYHLEELIKGTKDKLILISPYLQFSQRIKEHIENLNIQKKDIRIVFRESKLQLDENNWLEKQIGVRTSICSNLHAKCYINESEAIITSMNLYEFSQQNNNEMGIHITKVDDSELYNDTLIEVNRLITISKEIRVSIQEIPSAHQNKTEKKNAEITYSSEKPFNKSNAFCIRTGVHIPFNIERPFSYDAYKKWNEFANIDYPEKFCHFSGEKSDGETSMDKPILKKNWKKAKEIFGLK
ncbi:MAG: phospholipase D family protein [Bacteroidota bacterium]|nr:phospholipase D family protein [Bacteroidota bacterium]